MCDIIAAAAPAAPAAVAVSAAASAASSALVVCLPQHLRLSNDGLKLTWKSVGANEVVPDGSGTDRGSPSAAKSLLRSASFSKSTSITLSDVSHIIYGPYTDTFAKKTYHDRTDQRWACFSLVLRESRTVDFAAEDETILLPWLLGLQQLIVYFSPTLSAPNERWTLPKLHLQKLRLKVSGESDKTGQGPYDVVLHAVLDVADEIQIGNEKSTILQAAWRRRNTQGKFQTAVQEMMEINGLIESLEERVKDLKVQQDSTAAKIEANIKRAEAEEPPPKMPSDKEMKDPKKMQEYMLQMGPKIINDQNAGVWGACGARRAGGHEMSVWSSTVDAGRVCGARVDGGIDRRIL